MKRGLLLLLILVGVASGCEKVDPTTQIDVVTDFTINMIENLSASGSNLALDVVTLKDENCLNSEIAYSFNGLNNALTLSLLNIVTPEDCQEGEAPATALVQIGDLAAVDYDFNIDLKGQIRSYGSLSVMQDRYLLNFQIKNGFRIPHVELMRVPATVMWGYVNHITEEQDVVNEFIAELEGISTATNLNDGYYGWYEIENQALSSVKGELRTGVNTRFIFNHPENIDDLTNRIAVFRTNNPTLRLELRTGTGRSY